MSSAIASPPTSSDGEDGGSGGAARRRRDATRLHRALARRRGEGRSAGHGGEGRRQRTPLSDGQCTVRGSRQSGGCRRAAAAAAAASSPRRPSHSPLLARARARIRAPHPPAASPTRPVQRVCTALSFSAFPLSIAPSYLPSLLALLLFLSLFFPFHSPSSRRPESSEDAPPRILTYFCGGGRGEKRERKRFRGVNSTPRR